MAENKTIPTAKSVPEFLDKIDDPAKKSDSIALTLLMERVTGSKPTMWGDSIVGFGEYHYTYASGREGDWFLAGFSPRKQYLTVYIMGYLEYFSHILENLGRFRHGKGCLYIKRLEDIDLEVLESLITISVERLKSL